MGRTQNSRATRSCRMWRRSRLRYGPFIAPVFEGFGRRRGVHHRGGCGRSGVEAANDRSGRLRFAAGPDAVALAGAVTSPARGRVAPLPPSFARQRLPSAPLPIRGR